MVRRGLAESGAKAQALIMAGKVKAPGRDDLKPGLLVSEEQELILLEGLKYVSRGGDKLAGALDSLKVDPAGRNCLDVGASTGGFTDCLLQRGTAKVFAVDVGTHQLHEKLRKDPRVTSREQTHILKLTRSDLDSAFPSPISHPPSPGLLVVVDVSFIPLEKVLPHLASLTDAGAEFIVLVKPQFEVGPKLAPKGVVRDPAAREVAIRKVADALPGWGFELKGECPSPLPGPEGNVEHFLRFVRT